MFSLSLFPLLSPCLRTKGRARRKKTKATFTWRHTMKTLSLIVLVLSFTFTTPVIAADKDRYYWVQGAISCGDWVKDRKKGGWVLNDDTYWIAGYITAYNLLTPDVHNIMGNTDMDSIYLWMDKYCQENPLSNLAGGMEILTHELWPNRKRTKDD